MSKLYIPRGHQKPAIADATGVDVTYTQNAVAGNGSVTIADGTSPSNDELLEYVQEVKEAQDALIIKVNLLIAALEEYTLIAK